MEMNAYEKQREVLELCDEIMSDVVTGVRCMSPLEGFEEMGRIIDKALSSPPRNCDRFKTKEEAALAYAEECNAFIPQSILWQIGEWLDWLFAEAKGERNGSK